MGWTIVDDFDHVTAGGAKCWLYGTIKQKDDVGVFNAGDIENEYGRLEFSQQAIEDAASMLGWVPPSRIELMENRIKVAEEALAQSNEKLKALESLRDTIDDIKEIFPKPTIGTRRK